MAFVSICTIGRLNYPYDHPASREFFQVGNEVYRRATKSGLIEAFSPEGVPFPEETVKGRVPRDRGGYQVRYPVPTYVYTQ